MNMDQKIKKIVTYGKSARNRTHATGISIPHPVSNEQRRDSEVIPRSNQFKQLPQLLESKHENTQNSYDQSSTSTNSHSDQDVHDSQGSKGEDYGTTGRKRRRIIINQKSQQGHSSVYDGRCVPEGELSPREPTPDLDATGDTATKTIYHERKYKEQALRKSPQKKATGKLTGPGSMPKTETSSTPNPAEISRASSQFLPEETEGNSGTVSYRRRLVDSLDATERPARSLPSSPMIESPAQSHPSNTQPIPDSHQSNTLNADISSQESAALTSSVLRGSKVTYARQRSFLSDASITSGIEDTSASPTDHRDLGRLIPTHEFTPQIFPHADDDEKNDNGPVRSIHELRQAGANARFRSTIESIFEDIEDAYNSNSGRCHSFVQLCEKLLDPQFVRRFSEYGFDERLAKCTTSRLDIASASLALCACRLISSSGLFSHISLTTLWSNLLDLSPALLHVGDDLMLVMKQRSMGLSKAVQMSIKGILPQISSIVYGDLPLLKISPRFLALCCIKFSLSRFRERDDSIEPISTPLLNGLVDLLIQGKGDVMKTPMSPEKFQTLALTFSILENYTILSGSSDYDTHNSFRQLSKLYKFLDLNHCDQGRQILGFYIRVILNITNNDPSLCSYFATPELVGGFVKIIITEFCDVSEESLADENSSLNTVILALGALINMTEKSESSRAIFLKSTSDSPSFIQLLLQQFFASIGSVPKAHSVPEVHRHVAIGYLSILLVTLCLNIEVCSQVKESSDGQGLNIILSAAEEFLHYHQKVEQDPLESQKHKKSELATRLEHIMCQIRQYQNALQD